MAILGITEELVLSYIRQAMGFCAIVQEQSSLAGHAMTSIISRSSCYRLVIVISSELAYSGFPGCRVEQRIRKKTYFVELGNESMRSQFITWDSPTL